VSVALLVALAVGAVAYLRPHLTHGLGATPAVGAATGRRPWTAIHNWVYWINNSDVSQIGSSAYELAVIDYSADGSDGSAFTAAQIARLRASGCHRRVVAYFSIGEAETYRWYWQSGWRPGATNTPTWLVGADPGWPDNYWVRYWDPGWRQILFQYLDRILAAGFDGVYLDRIDAYAEPYAAGHTNAMLQLVSDIASYARARSPLGQDFGVIAQNAEELGSDHPAYVRTLTGIGREEVYVQATDAPTAPADTAGAEAALQTFRQSSRGHLVLTVDYATQPSLIRTAYTRSRAQGFVPYVSDVALDTLRVNPGYAPTCSAY
jgi:cysteinyl-tRNA synthetase